MTKTLLTSDQLSKLINECIQDLQAGGGAKLADFAAMMQCLAEATGTDIYYIVPQVVGGFMNETLLFRQLISIPILEKTTRLGHQKKLEDAIKSGIESLKVYEKEFCQNKKPDYVKVVKATAAMTRSGYGLYQIRESILGTRPRTPSSGEGT